MTKDRFMHSLVEGYGLSNGKMERSTLYADAIVPSRTDDTCEQVDIKTPYKGKYRFMDGFTRKFKKYLYKISFAWVGRIAENVK